MMTSKEAGQAAEESLVAYVGACGAHTPDDVRKVLEMLLSKAARGIEKYCGNQIAIEVLLRTTDRVASVPAPTGTVQ